MTKAEFIKLIKDCSDDAEMCLDVDGSVFDISPKAVKIYADGESIVITGN